MRSKTSFFNLTVFWSDCRHFWPLTAGYTLMWLLLLPLSRLTAWNHVRALSAWDMNREALNLAANSGYWVAFFTGILFAMAAFSYLTNPRATNGLHALPARRETLYVTHYLSGLCCQLAPQLLAVLLTAAVMASHRALDPRVIGLMLLSLVLPALFFYSFAVFCMMFTGQILAAPVFYFVLNILVVGVELLLRTLAGNFLYGWAEAASPALTALSPIVRLAENGVRATTTTVTRMADGSIRVEEAVGSRIGLLGFDWLLIYAAAGLVFAALGLLVYRARHSEATGSTVAIEWARPVFQYGVTFCAALALGQLLYYLFFGQYRTNGVYSLPGTLLCMAAAGLIGYFAAEMLLKKSFRVLKSGWKGAVVVTAVLIALGCLMSADLTGYESYVPKAEDIFDAHVAWNGYGSSSCYATVRDPETLRLVTEAHRAVANDKLRQQSLGWNSGVSNTQLDGFTQGYFSVTYDLKDGRVVRRRYSPITLYASELSDPSSPAAAMTALYNAEGVALQRALGLGDWYNEYRDPRALSDLRFTGGYVDLTLWGAEDYLYSEEHDLTPAEAERVFDAILRDVAAGRISDSLFDESGGLDVGIELYASYYDTKDYSSPVPSTRPDTDENGRVATTFHPALTEQMTETLETLRGMGIHVTFD